MIILHPDDEYATEQQLQHQILTNANSTDPTHKHEASCSYGSSYRHYVHYYCQGYTFGGQDEILTLEATVDEVSGAVSVEPLLE